MAAPAHGSNEALQRVVDALRNLGCQPKHSYSGQYYAYCPVHERDGNRHNPSLAVGPGTRIEGAVGITCHAGCDTRDITAALNLTEADLFNDTDQPDPPKVTTLKRPVAEYPYVDERGTLLYHVVRFEPKDFRPRRADGAYTMRDTRKVLYNLPQVLAARDAGRMIFLVEGEKDADNLTALGVVATTNAGGAKKWADDYTDTLDGANVTILPDNDEQGRGHADHVAAQLHGRAASVRIINLPGLGHKGDVSDWIGNGGSQLELRKAVNDTPPLDTPPDDAGDDHDDEPDIHGWEPVDVAAVLSGDYQPPQPRYLAREDDQPLIYPAATNAIFGESETGKSWIALHAAAQALNAGHGVAYVDFEATAPVILNRLLALGVDPQSLIDHLTYISPHRPLTDAAAAAVRAEIDRTGAELAVLDGITGAMGLHGLNPLDNSDVEKFDRMLPRPLAEDGLCVLQIDHVTKDRENRQRYAIGAQHKLAAISGAAYRVDPLKPIAPGHHGELKLTIAKDRHGQIREANPSFAGVFHLDASDPEQPRAWVDAPPDKDKPFRPTVLMERVSRHLELIMHPVSKKEIHDSVPGRADALHTAINLLIDEGYVSVKKEGAALMCTSTRRYRDEEQT